PRPAHAGAAEAADRRQRRGRRRAAQRGGQPGSGAGAHQPPLRRGAEPPAQAVGRRDAGVAARVPAGSDPVDRQPSRRFNNALTWAGLALPRLAFMTWPTSALKALSLPARYSSTDFGLA